MKCVLMVIVLMLLVSCKSKNNSKSQVDKKAWFSQELNSKLLDYQNLYPLPIDNKRKKSGLYVYIVSFYKTHSDTMVTIKRAADGIYLSGWNLILGVYQNNQLAPTIIRDTSSFYSKRFINKMISDSLSLKQFQPIEGAAYPESFPPVYEYKVENDRLLLNRIDTVWNQW